jgi:hypothetical protein
MPKRMFLALLLAVAPLAAAADRDAASAAIASARGALELAERVENGAAPSRPLATARERLADADRALAAKSWRTATLAAGKAEADARLAAARARQLRAEATASELEAAVATLRTEIVESQ